MVWHTDWRGGLHYFLKKVQTILFVRPIFLYYINYGTDSDGEGSHGVQHQEALRHMVIHEDA